MNKTCWLTALFVLTFLTGAQAYDDLAKLFVNNKEPVSSSLSQSEMKSALETFQGQAGDDLVFAFTNSVSLYFEEVRGDGDADHVLAILESLCDLKFLDAFETELSRQGYPTTLDQIQSYLKLLRAKNAIDDLLYDILSALAVQKAGLEAAGKKTGAPWFLGRYEGNEILAEADLDWVFGAFTPWRKEGENCLYRPYHATVGRIKETLDKSKGVEDHFKSFNFEAFNQRVVDEESFWQLEYLRKNDEYYKSALPLGRYLNTLVRVKDQMLPKTYSPEPIPVELENPFVSEKLSRWKSISRRKLLYKKYSPNQIIMLSQVLEKASRRMGTDPDVESSVPVIIQEFSFIDEMGVRQNYVERTPLDAQSQYNYARRRMRMDIMDLQNMSAFAGVRIEYSDIVTAALETGYITHEDISYVLGYDDLWNPETEPWARLKKFCYSLGRASILYLPSPYNIIGTVGLATIQSFLNDDRRGVDNDNPATLIE